MLKRLLASLIIRLNNAVCRFFAIRILLGQRRKAIIEKQIELINKVTDQNLVKTFIDETRIKKPITKMKLILYAVFVISILALGGYNIEPILIIIKPFLGF